jgi:hypothetical protein
LLDTKNGADSSHVGITGVNDEWTSGVFGDVKERSAACEDDVALMPPKIYAQRCFGFKVHDAAVN